jgi:hypothetical protein
MNGYHFQMVKLEASCPLAATSNNKIVKRAKNANRVVANYNGILLKIIEYTVGGARELKVVFF